MSVLSSTKPDAWTLSPQMTAEPNLWRSCVAFFPFWEGVGNAVFSHAGHVGTFQGSGVTWKRGENGTYLSFAGNTGDWIRVPFGNLPSGRGLSYFARLRHSTSGASSVQAAYMHSDGAGANEIAFFAYLGGGDSRAYFDDERSDYTTDAPDQQWYNNCIRVINTPPGAAANARRSVYMNDIEEYNATIDTDINPSDVLLIGADADSGTEGSLGNFFIGDIDCFAVFDRALEVNELTQLAEDPYIMLRPAGF